MSDAMRRTGRCLCGAVTYTATLAKAEMSACHCGMCRRWSGGVLLSVGTAGVELEGDVATYPSSDWAERGFCPKCGTSLFFRMTAPEKYAGFTSIMFGTLDDQSGIELAVEWFSDRRPDAITLAGERKTITEAEAFAMLADA